jgi:DNA-binding transcriptional LysR family regulator
MEIPSWDDLRVLLAVHREQSFLAAGRTLGLSTSTTGRRIDALEAALGRKLVSRSRSGAELQPEALRLIRLAEQLEYGLDVERRDARSMAGTVKVSVPEGSTLETAQALIAFRRQHPDTEIELLGENRLSDIAKREADIGIRIARSTSSVLIEKQLATLRFGIYASSEYARRHIPSGRLRKEDVAMHPFVGLQKRWEGLAHEQWMRILGAKRFPFRSNSVLAIVEAIREGAGLGALVERVGQNAGLARIDVHLPGPAQPIYLVYHRELRNVPRIKAVVAALVEYSRAYG